MADITIESVGKVETARAPHTLVFTSASNGYMFFIDDDDDFKYRKTTDGGQTWAAAVTIKTGVVYGSDVWYDRWTPGITGTIIHTWYMESGVDDVFYRALDTATDTLDTERTVFAGASGATGLGTQVSGTKARGGNLYCYFNLDAGTETGLYRSTDGGVTWGVRTNLFEANPDQLKLMPGNEADAQDIYAIFLDASANELTIKTHDDSANTNSESTQLAPLTDQTSDAIGQYGWGATVRHSDGHLIVPVWTEYDSATGDLRVWDVASGTSFSELTAIATNITNSYWPSVCIDQDSDEIYVAYIGKKDGSETLDLASNTASVCYVKSSDAGATWGGEVVYSAATGNWRQTWCNPQGPRFMVAWRNATTQALVTNYDNSLAFGLAASLTAEGVLTTPSLRAFTGVAGNITGELQLTADLVSWGWQVALTGEGALLADLTGKDLRATLRGEGALVIPDLAVFPGWQVALTGEGALTEPTFTTSAWEASLTAEGALTEPTFGTSLACALRAELQTPTFALLTDGVDVFEANLVAEGRLRASLFSPADTSAIEYEDGEWVPEPAGMIDGSLTITEDLQGGNSAELELSGLYPELGEAVNVALDDGDVFSGLALKTRRYYLENRRIARTAVTAFGRDWNLTRYRITASYENVSATDIITEIGERAGLDVSNVQAGLPTVDHIAFARLQLQDALTQTLDYIGGHWRVESGVLFAGVVETGEDPDPLTPQNLAFTDLEIVKDLTQTVNRLTVIGAGASTIAPPPLTFPDYFSVELDQLYGIDRSKFYPKGSTTRLYVTEVTRENPDETDDDGNEFVPARQVAPTPIFNPSGGTIIVDDKYELEYASAGVQEMPLWDWSTSAALGVTLEGPTISLGPGSMQYRYAATVVTQWGESTRRAESQVVDFGYNEFGLVTSSPVIRVLPTLNPVITAINIYRQSTVGMTWTPWRRVGSTPATGGVLNDTYDIGRMDDEDELPLINTATPPALPYVQLATPLRRRVRVGASVRVVRTVDDLPSQSLLGTILGDEGIVEDVLQDDNLGYQQLESVARAHLAVRSLVETTLSWTTTDRKTRAGRMIAADLPDVRGTFKIQAVRIDGFQKISDGTEGYQPLYRATASNRRFTINELLKRVK